MYAKFVNEQSLEEAPVEFEIDGRKYVGFTRDFLLEQGYKPVIFASNPDGTSEDNYSKLYESYYVESDSQILQKWREKTT